jgi:hypothetical protein
VASPTLGFVDERTCLDAESANRKNEVEDARSRVMGSRSFHPIVLDGADTSR